MKLFYHGLIQWFPTSVLGCLLACWFSLNCSCNPRIVTTRKFSLIRCISCLD
uniref:Uncharacterized protein n=1 Tax=Anguilla anguilla TaxID=7936 RepID=A0A0E9UDH6_ANGAN